MSQKIYKRKPKIKATMKYLVVLVVVLLVAIVQDLLQSTSNDYSLYESDSFLYDSFFLWILPIAWVLHLAFSRIPGLYQIRSLFVKRILFVILATGLEILLFTGMIQVVTVWFHGQEFNFLNNLGYVISVDLYKYLLIYSLIALILIRREKRFKSTSMP